MPLVMRDFVMETSLTNGTGSMTLGGAPAGFSTFASQFANGDTLYYAIRQTGGSWEVGLGTFAAPSTLARTSVLDSSAGGAAVNWGAGTKVVYCTLPAGVAMLGGNNLSEITNAATARAALGVGSVALQNSPLPVANGGTAGTTAATARNGLGATTIGGDIFTAADAAAVRTLLGMSLPLAVASGGTGQTTAIIPTGTVMLFAQAAAPTGWTQVVTWNDRVLRIVSGGTGGGTGGAWAISGMGGTSISVANLPSAAGSSVTWKAGSIREADMASSSGSRDVVELIRATFVGGDTQTNTASLGAGTTHTHTGDGTWRPAYTDVIAASKN